MWSQFLSSSGPQSRGREEIDPGMSSTLPEMISSLTDGKKECGQMRKITVTAPVMEYLLEAMCFTILFSLNHSNNHT